MRLSNEQIKALQALLKEKYGWSYTSEQAQEAGMAILRFVVTKARRQQELSKYKEQQDGSL